MTKREVLLAICEKPGWQPPVQASSIERALDQLQAEGWLLPRLDGWEATTAALDAYPRFSTQPDIADPEPPPSVRPAAGVPIERVQALLVGLLIELPLAKVQALAALTPDRLGEFAVQDPLTTHLAGEIARQMADG